MNPVVTAEQARAITGKSTGPLTLPTYERACELLQECTSVIEGKKWVDRASAYASIARILRDERALRLSRTLLYKSAIVCRALAIEEAQERLRQRNEHRRSEGLTLLPPRAAPVREILIENGFTRNEAEGARILSKLSPAQQEQLAARPRPPSLGSINDREDTSPIGAALMSLASFISRESPSAWAKQAQILRGRRGPREIAAMRQRLEEISEWCADAMRVFPER